MDKWIKYRKGHANIAYTPDVIIAAVLRLIGESSPSLNAFSLLTGPCGEQGGVRSRLSMELHLRTDFAAVSRRCALDSFS